MDPDGCDNPQPPSIFRLFTKESLTKIDRRIKDDKLAKEAAKEKRAAEVAEGKGMYHASNVFFLLSKP